MVVVKRKWLGRGEKEFLLERGEVDGWKIK